MTGVLVLLGYLVALLLLVALVGLVERWDSEADR